MKYIRTKDRVLETNRLPIERFSIELVKIIDKQVGLPNPHIEEIEIIKQADTIEELCDEFVAEDRDEFAIFHNLKLAKQTKGIIYGAVWSDKGLIYVEKMDEKGELCLI